MGVQRRSKRTPRRKLNHRRSPATRIWSSLPHALSGAPEPSDVLAVETTYDSVGYQTALSQALASIKTVIQRRQLDPLRYIVEIDAGLPIFATRSTHQLRIAYNRFQDLSMEATIPHEWMLEQAGKGHEDFLLAVDDMVLALKSKVQAAGRPM